MSYGKAVVTSKQRYATNTSGDIIAGACAAGAIGVLLRSRTCRSDAAGGTPTFQ